MDKISAGWNDPPPVNYVNQNPGSKSRLLNKRVPFNFSNSNIPLPTSEVLQVSKLPESTIPENIPATRTESNVDVTQVLEKLNNIIDIVQDSNKKTDILKRLDIMKEMWNANEINDQVQQQILNFANFLELNDVKQANEIYISLTLNSATVCSSWLVAFKYILHHYKV